MEDNVYAAPDSDPRQDDFLLPGNQGEFGQFEFRRALELMRQGFFNDPLRAVFIIILLILFMVVSFLTLCGLPFALPHFFVALSLLGLHLVRNNLSFNHIFLGFTNYGPVLGACLLIFLGYSTYMGLVSQILPTTLAAPFPEDLDPEAMRKFFQKLFQQTGSLTYWLTGILSGLPSTYLAMRFLLVLPLIIERRTPVFKAFSLSWQATARNHLEIFAFILGFDIVVYLIQFLGNSMLMENLFAEGGFKGGGALYSSLISIFVSLFVVYLIFLVKGAAMFLLLGEDRPGKDSDQTRITKPDRRPGATETGNGVGFTSPDDDASERNIYG